MKNLRFELTGILGAQEFVNETNIKEESERLFKGIIKKIESVSKCKVVNDEFVIDIVDSEVIHNEDMIEKDITFKIILETTVRTCLSEKEMLDLIDHVATEIETKLALAVVEPCKEYEYEIVNQNFLWDEEEFISAICENIEKPEIKSLASDIARCDYTKSNLSLEELMKISYEMLEDAQIIDYCVSLDNAIGKYQDPDMKYYELNFYYKNPTEKSLRLFGEGGLTWYFKSETAKTHEDVLNECLEKFKNSVQGEDLLEARESLDEIREITKEEFYSQAF